MFGLDAHTLATLTQFFALYPHITQVLIYGSRAMGNFHKGSDIDLAVFAPDKANIVSLKAALEELPMPLLTLNLKRI